MSEETTVFENNIFVNSVNGMTTNDLSKAPLFVVSSCTTYVNWWGTFSNALLQTREPNGFIPWRDYNMPGWIRK